MLGKCCSFLAYLATTLVMYLICSTHTHTHTHVLWSSTDIMMLLDELCLKSLYSISHTEKYSKWNKKYSSCRKTFVNWKEEIQLCKIFIYEETLNVEMHTKHFTRCLATLIQCWIRTSLVASKLIMLSQTPILSCIPAITSNSYSPCALRSSMRPNSSHFWRCVFHIFFVHSS